jgi:hypothetical protein
MIALLASTLSLDVELEGCARESCNDGTVEAAIGMR